MQLAPKSKEDWVDLCLVPAKVFAAVGVALTFLRVSAHGLSPTVASILAVGFWLSVPFLLFGALVQSIWCKRGSATRTLLFFGWLFAIVHGGVFLAGLIVMAPLGWLMLRFIRFTEQRAPGAQEPIECLECHAVIVVGQTHCRVCGWTFNS